MLYCLSLMFLRTQLEEVRSAIDVLLFNSSININKETPSAYWRTYKH